MLYGKCGICTGRKDAVTRAVPVDDDDRSDVLAYLETMVGKGDTVALLAVSRWKSAPVVQEIQRVEDLARPESVQRLDVLNRVGYDVYCTVNTVNPEAAGRTKADIASVRRLQLDLDEGGREGLARLRRDVEGGVVPTPAVIMQSSRDRYQVLWNTREGAWTPAGAEGTMTRLAGRYGGREVVPEDFGPAPEFEGNAGPGPTPNRRHAPRRYGDHCLRARCEQARDCSTPRSPERNFPSRRPRRRSRCPRHSKDTSQ